MTDINIADIDLTGPFLPVCKALLDRYFVEHPDDAWADGTRWLGRVLRDNLLRPTGDARARAR